MLAEGSALHEACERTISEEDPAVHEEADVGADSDEEGGENAAHDQADNVGSVTDVARVVKVGHDAGGGRDLANTAIRRGHDQEEGGREALPGGGCQGRKGAIIVCRGRGQEAERVERRLAGS
jgi:hypothetical protein